jgi:hypothetical protein
LDFSEIAHQYFQSLTIVMKEAVARFEISVDIAMGVEVV